MNAQAKVEDVTRPAEAVEKVAQDMSMEKRQADMEARIEQIQSSQLRSMLDKQNDLISRLEGLASLNDVSKAEEQRLIIEAELADVRAEIAKRQENVGVLAYELFGLYDELGMKASASKEDNEEDVAKREASKTAVENARKNVGAAEAKLASLDADNDESQAGKELAGLQQALTEAGSDWKFWARAANVAAAEEAINAFETANVQAKFHAETAIETAQAAVLEAEEAEAEVHAQIEIDKADRVRTASLKENFALIAEFTRQATTVIKEDIAETEERRMVTEKALSSALKARRDTAAELDEVRDGITKITRDHAREQDALAEIPDQSSADYAEQHARVVDFENQLTEARSEELKLNTRHMSLTAAIEASRSSVAGLTTQRDTAEVFLIKLQTAEKTAHLLGENIDRMIKMTMGETASDALDQGMDKMIHTAHALGIQAQVSSGKIRNNAIERHDEMMRRLVNARDAGDEAMAIEGERYIQLDEKLRKGYGDLGVDVDMSHLEAAAKAFSEREVPAKGPTDEIVY